MATPVPLSFDDYTPSIDRPVGTLRMKDIQQLAAIEFGINVAEMTSASRQRAAVRPRQVAMYLCRELTSRSLNEIGRAFGGRDHATILHGIKAVPVLMQRDAEFAAHVDHLRAYLEQKLSAMRPAPITAAPTDTATHG